jgi:hypothetical protein
MGSEPGREAIATGTGFRIYLQQDDQCETGVYTYIDRANPIRSLLSGECPPFSPYRRLCTGALLESTRHGKCRPKNCQRDRRKLVNIHVWVRCCVNGGVNSGSIYWLGM